MRTTKTEKEIIKIQEKKENFTLSITLIFRPLKKRPFFNINLDIRGHHHPIPRLRLDKSHKWIKLLISMDRPHNNVKWNKVAAHR
jgi:hypothetical protein